MKISLLGVAFVFVSCETDAGALAGQAASAKGSVTSAQQKKTSKLGRIAYGALGTHFDRNNNGIFEEIRTGKTTYFDRDSNGVADLVIEGQQPHEVIQWDSDFDGILDRTVTSNSGYVHEFSNSGVIRIQGQRLFQYDRIQGRGSCKLEDPHYKHWEQFLNLPSPSKDLKAPPGK